ncbi:MAG: DUF6084 family protein [Terriglobales bacterium]
MPDLDFAIEGCEAASLAASPQVSFKLRVTNPDPAETIHTVSLRCQIQIEVTRRRYSAEDQTKLRDLFGEASRWGQTLRNFLWTHVNVNIPAFQGSTVVDLLVPCTFDFNIAATKYFHGLKDGDVPLCAMFSGSVFYSRAGDAMQVAPISWNKETRFGLPVSAWREMMDSYYPGVAWLCLRRDVFERLNDYKVRHGIPTWEQAIESMLQAEEVVRA